MRIVQFRKHLDMFVVRVTDAQDIAILSANPQFKLLLRVEEETVSGPRILSVEYIGITDHGVAFEQWSKDVWRLIGIRNEALKSRRQPK